MKKLGRIFFWLLLVGSVAFMLWPLESKAECKVHETLMSSMNSHITGLEDKYIGAEKFYLYVDIYQSGLGEELQKENVTKIAKRYLERRMLPCTGHSEVEVVEKPQDKRLGEENVLIAFVKIRYQSGYPESANSVRGYGPNSARILSGYYRTGISEKLQIDDTRVMILSLEREDEGFEDTVGKFVRGSLAPQLKSLPSVQ